MLSIKEAGIVQFPRGFCIFRVCSVKKLGSLLYLTLRFPPAIVLWFSHIIYKGNSSLNLQRSRRHSLCPNPSAHSAKVWLLPFFANWPHLTYISFHARLFDFFNGGLLTVFISSISRLSTTQNFSLLATPEYFFFFFSILLCSAPTLTCTSVCAQNHSLQNPHFSMACVSNYCNPSINPLVRSITFLAQILRNDHEGGPVWSWYTLSFCHTIVAHFFNDRIKADINIGSDSS